MAGGFGGPHGRGVGRNLGLLGFWDAWPHGIVLGGAGKRVLAPSQLHTISHCTGLQPRGLQAMTLQPWIKGSSWQRRSVASMRVTGSRFCPVCLKERGGRWRVWWRLRWAFAVRRMDVARRRLLRVRRSATNGTASVQRGAEPWVVHARVTRSGEIRRCGGRLSSVPVIYLGLRPAVVIQRELLRMLRAGHASDGIYAVVARAIDGFHAGSEDAREWMLRTRSLRCGRSHFGSALGTVQCKRQRNDLRAIDHEWRCADDVWESPPLMRPLRV